MPYDLTVPQYTRLCADRRVLIKRLLMQLLPVPEGYVVNDDPLKMFGNSMLSIRPRHPAPGSRMINFIHQITYQSRWVNGFRRAPVEESIRAVCDVYLCVQKHSVLWESDTEFGINGKMTSMILRGYTDEGLATAVREIVSKISSQSPFINFDSKKCPDNPPAS